MALGSWALSSIIEGRCSGGNPTIQHEDSEIRFTSHVLPPDKYAFPVQDVLGLKLPLAITTGRPSLLFAQYSRHWWVSGLSVRAVAAGFRTLLSRRGNSGLRRRPEQIANAETPALP
jgi:hypothetical protein